MVKFNNKPDKPSPYTKGTGGQYSVTFELDCGCRLRLSFQTPEELDKAIHRISADIKKHGGIDRTIYEIATQIYSDCPPLSVWLEAHGDKHD